MGAHACARRWQSVAIAIAVLIVVLRVAWVRGPNFAIGDTAQESLRDSDLSAKSFGDPSSAAVSAPAAGSLVPLWNVSSTAQLNAEGEETRRDPNDAADGRRYPLEYFRIRYGKTGGQQTWDESPDKSAFRFLHISKTGGKSLIKEARRHGVFLAHKEHCYGVLGHVAGAVNMVMLRSPRAHVYSQFLMCRFSKWGKSVIRSTTFPRVKNTIANATLLPWLKHFDPEQWFFSEGKASSCRKRCFNCYHPLNMQTRFLTCAHGFPRRIEKRFLSGDTLDQAKRTLQTFEWVGVTELFHESLCLLFYQARGGRLPARCDCASQEGKKYEEARVTHGLPAHDVRDLGPAIRRRVDALTKLDRGLYAFALGRLLRRLRDMEAETGTPTLCADKRERIVRRLGDDVRYAWAKPHADVLETWLGGGAKHGKR